jgi:predicted anti-sigma-YlaC factor YlaD
LLRTSLSSRLLTALCLLSAAACSPRTYVINSAADALTSGTSSMGTEDDPDFLLESLPFGLLSLESLARSAPDHVGLRETLASGFVQYAYVGSDMKAELVKYDSFAEYSAYQDLARKRYLRGKRWGMEGLALKHKTLTPEALAANPKEAVKVCTKEDLGLLYWTGAGWLAAISISVDRADLLAELPQASALLDRAMELDPDYDNGSLHELFVSLDMARDASQGGGEASALKHFDRALELSGGKKASTYVTYAGSIAVKKQDLARFNEMLDKALAIDLNANPELRLVNMLAQQRAHYLKDHIEDMFDLAVEPEGGNETPSAP